MTPIKNATPQPLTTREMVEQAWKKIRDSYFGIAYDDIKEHDGYRSVDRIYLGHFAEAIAQAVVKQDRASRVREVTDAEVASVIREVWPLNADMAALSDDKLVNGNPISAKLVRLAFARAAAPSAEAVREAQENAFVEGANWVAREASRLGLFNIPLMPAEVGEFDMVTIRGRSARDEARAKYAPPAPRPEPPKGVTTTDDIGGTVEVRYEDGWYCAGVKSGKKHADLAKLIRAYSLDPTDREMAALLALAHTPEAK